MVVHAAKNAYLGKLAPKDSYYFANDEIFCHFFAYTPSFFFLLSSYSYDFAAFPRVDFITIADYFRAQLILSMSARLPVLVLSRRVNLSL